jgi:N-acetylglucosaminyl-diphospho-decaprenol L-rhamnosyltransferase
MDQTAEVYHSASTAYNRCVPRDSRGAVLRLPEHSIKPVSGPLSCQVLTRGKASCRMEAVLVSYNSAPDLRGFLDCAPLRKSFSRLIMVDNASTDGSPEMAERADIEVVRRSRNDGFGAAANAGIRRTTSPLVALLNPDIRFEGEDVAARLGRHFANSCVGLVAPGLLLPDGMTQDSAREVPTPLDLVLRRRIERFRGAIKPTEVTAVPWVVGACMVLRRSAFDGVGGFDERFLLYFEDTDLCVRLRKQGWEVLLDPEVVVAHRHRAASRKSILGWSTRQHIRSAIHFYRTHPAYLLPSGPIEPTH